MKDLPGILSIVLIAALAWVSSCAPNANSSSSGGNVYLTVMLEPSAVFSAHNIYFFLGRNMATNAQGEPADKTGWGVVGAGPDGGGSGIVRSLADQSDLELSDGTWYLYCLADTNNTIFSSDGTGILRDSGDLFTPILPVTVSGNTSITIKLSDFLFQHP